MPKVVILGNAGSGNSSLAMKIASQNDLPHLDLDTVAWQRITPPARKAIADSMNEVWDFISNQKG